MQAEYLLGSLKFISQGGAVSMTVAAMLLAMSIGSWTLMVIKAIQARRLKSSSVFFLVRFWQASPATPTAISEDLKTAETPFARLAIQGINAAEHHRRYTAQRPGETTRNCDEFIAQALRRVIGQEAMRLETGLTLLASVGSIAPFIGLFGTVWGIYHALGSIAVGG
ncbi:MAG: MotA/TolQ/ExbB proton channel family protein, partial [Methylobacter sp.]